MFVVHISKQVQRTLCALRPGMGTRSCSLITLGRMQRNVLQLQQFTQYQFSFHMVLITAGWTEAVWIQSLPKAFTHNLRCQNRTPDPLHDLRSKALTIQPRATLYHTMLLFEMHIWKFYPYGVRSNSFVSYCIVQQEIRNYKV